MEAMGEAALGLVAEFVEGLPEAPAVKLEDADRLVPELLRPPPESPGQFDTLLHRFREAAAQAVETAGPGYMAYIPGGGLFAAALAEFLSRAVNRYTGLSGFAPALVALEESTLRWLGGEFGLPLGSAGLVTTGGSMATQTAVVAARHDRLGDHFADGTLYVTAHTHRCVAKAARIVGFRADQIRTVPTTAQLRMDPAEAARMIAADRAAGRRPVLLVGTAGTTDTGTVDPLGELAEVADRHGLWFHVDAAYGGFFNLTERGRVRLAGIEAADSVVLDPHKGLFLPYGTGVLLVRDAATLRAAHAADGHYLQDVHSGVSLPDYADLGPELTRDFRGLRLWLPLHLHGVAAFRDALDEKLNLAAYAYRELAADVRLELPWEPDLSTVVFRLKEERDADQRNQQLLDRINATKRIHLSSTRIDGWYTVRLCVLSHRTHHEHVAEAVDIIRRAAH
jgi:aromatic-L-amino-acid decarboxylase